MNYTAQSFHLKQQLQAQYADAVRLYRQQRNWRTDKLLSTLRKVVDRTLKVARCYPLPQVQRSVQLEAMAEANLPLLRYWFAHSYCTSTLTCRAGIIRNFYCGFMGSRSQWATVFTQLKNVLMKQVKRHSDRNWTSRIAFILGNREAYQHLNRQFKSRLDAPSFSKLRHLSTQAASYALCQYALCLGRPNCKESPGGLRDLQANTLDSTRCGHRADMATQQSRLYDRQSLTTKKSEELFSVWGWIAPA